MNSWAVACLELSESSIHRIRDAVCSGTVQRLADVMPARHNEERKKISLKGVCQHVISKSHARSFGILCPASPTLALSPCDGNVHIRTLTPSEGSTQPSSVPPASTRDNIKVSQLSLFAVILCSARTLPWRASLQGREHTVQLT